MELEDIGLVVVLLRESGQEVSTASVHEIATIIDDSVTLDQCEQAILQKSQAQTS